MCQTAVMDRVQDSTRILEWTTLPARHVAGASPARVEKPCVGVVVGHLGRKHGGVLHGVQRQEGLSETRRKRGLGLRDAFLGTGDFRSVPADKVVHHLLGRQLRHGWQHTGRVARQQHDVLRVLVGQTWDLGAGDVVDGVRAARVFRDAAIVVIDFARERVEHHVLQHGTKLDGVVNLGLLLGGKPNALGVAPTFDVEHTVVGPAVLVVADELAVRVCGKRGFARAAEPKEQRHVVAVDALVGGRVQGENVVVDGHQVEHHGENALLHLARVLGAQDHHLHLLEVDLDRGLGGHALRVGVGRELAGVPDGELGLAKVAELFFRGPDQHVGHEQRVVRARAHDPNLDAVAGVPPGVRVHDVEVVARAQVVCGALAVDQPRLLRALLVDGAPPDVVRGRGLVDDALVTWRPPGLGPGVRDQRAGRGYRGLALAECVFVQQRGGRVSADGHHVLAQCEFLADGLLSGHWNFGGRHVGAGCWDDI